MAQAASYTDPASKLISITASDDTDLTGVRGLYVGGDGDLAVRMVDDPTTTVTLAGVTAGAIIPIRVTRVMAATTATNIVGMM